MMLPWSMPVIRRLRLKSCFAHGGAQAMRSVSLRHSLAIQGSSRVGQRATGRAVTGAPAPAAQPGRRRNAVPVSTHAVLSRLALLIRSGSVGGAVPASVQAARRTRQCSGAVDVAARPSGQQMSSARTPLGTLRGRIVVLPSAASRSFTSGADVLAPKWPGLGVPSGRPTHTPTV